MVAKELKELELKVMKMIAENDAILDSYGFFDDDYDVTAEHDNEDEILALVSECDAYENVLREIWRIQGKPDYFKVMGEKLFECLPDHEKEEIEKMARELEKRRREK